MCGHLNPFLKRLKSLCSALIFPPLCVHCQGVIEDHRQHLCKSCFDLLVLIPPQERCPLCFEKIFPKKVRCHRCPPQVLKCAAVFEHEGPIASLLQQFKLHRRFALANSLAPFLVLQWAALKWPLPDLIIPIPQTLSHRLQLGYNPSHLLATQLGLLLNTPVASLLKREGVTVSQTSLPLIERAALSSETFQWKTRKPPADQILLLIDDSMVTGATLRKAAERLKEAFPGQIFGLVVTGI